MFLVEQFFLCDIVSLVLGFDKLRITPLMICNSKWYFNIHLKKYILKTKLNGTT